MNKGLRWFMTACVLGSWLGWPSRPRTDLSGLLGVVNLELTTAPVYGWHFVVEAGRLRVRPGLHPSPATTIRLSEQSFIRLLEGRQSYTMAVLTGRVRIEGVAHHGVLLAGLCTHFRRLTTGTGLRGRLGRAFAAFILRRAALPPPAASSLSDPVA